MREKFACVIITFNTTSQAMAFEKYCLEQKIKGRLIPVPTQISAGCGICFKMLEIEYVKYQKQLDDLAHKNIHNLMI